MQQYYILVIILGVIIFYNFFVFKPKIEKMQEDGSFDKPIIDELTKYLKNDEKIQHYISSYKKNMFSSLKHYIWITDKRLIILKILDPRNPAKNILEIAENFENLMDLDIREITIAEYSNMKTVWYPWKQISFSVNNNKYFFEIKHNWGYQKNYEQEFEAICLTLLSQKK